MEIHGVSLRQIGEAEFELEKDYTGEKIIIFAGEELCRKLDQEVFIQSKNVAKLPGLAGPVCIMPDAHSGYGAPIGTVFAMRQDGGFVSPGAVGYDINCGMRLISTNLTLDEVKNKIEKLMNRLFEAVPAGIGRLGLLQLNKKEFAEMIHKGVEYLIKAKGIGRNEDLEYIEERGRIDGADIAQVSRQAIERGYKQLATLGSGNHYLEVQKVDRIEDEISAKKMGIRQVGQIVVMIHCGSRGFGHQIATDYLRLFENHQNEFQINLADRQLVCAPLNSIYAKKYLQAMAAAANFAFVNRQAITHQVRSVFSQVFAKSPADLKMDLIYDVAHNIAKIEKLPIPKSNKKEQVLVHRKGATRSYPDTPVIIGGSMETGSYLLMGTEKALEKSYGSTAHGSGRTMSRSQAKKLIHGKDLWQKLKDKGIFIKSASWSGLAEEAGSAYKNISDVVKSVESAGLSKRVAYLKPVGNIKG